jgi:hypothetical protein
VLDLSSQIFVIRIKSVHDLLQKTVSDLSDEQFFHQPSQAAPPIGWHLWHMGRWADRIQAGLPRDGDVEGYQPDLNNGIWEQEQLAARWELDPESLGKLEGGTYMDPADATHLAQQIGREQIVAYAERTFTLLDDALANVTTEQMHADRISVMHDPIHDPTRAHAPAKHTTLIADLGFHITHGYRHLGMMEALRGLSGEAGTVSV